MPKIKEKPLYRLKYTCEAIAALTGKETKYLMNKCSKDYGKRTAENYIALGKKLLNI